MYIAIDGHRSADLVITLQTPDCNGDVVDHAEALAMVGEGVMKSSANRDADFVGQGLARREDRSSGSQPKSIYEIARIRDFHLHLFARAEGAFSQSLHVVRLMHQKDVLIG